MAKIGDIARFRSQAADKNGPVTRRPLDPGNEGERKDFNNTHRDKVTRLIENEPGLSYYQITRALELDPSNALNLTRVSSLLHYLYKLGSVKRRKLDGLFRYYAPNYIDPRGGSFDDPAAVAATPRTTTSGRPRRGTNSRYHNLTDTNVLAYLARNPSATSREVFTALEGGDGKATRAMVKSAHMRLRRLESDGKVVAIHVDGSYEWRWYLADADGKPIVGRVEALVPPEAVAPRRGPKKKAVAGIGSTAYPSLTSTNIINLLTEHPGLKTREIYTHLYPDVRRPSRAQAQAAYHLLSTLAARGEVGSSQQAPRGSRSALYWFAKATDGTLVGFEEWQDERRDQTHTEPLPMPAPPAPHATQPPPERRIKDSLPPLDELGQTVEGLAKDFVWETMESGEMATLINFVSWVKERQAHGRDHKDTTNGQAA